MSSKICNILESILQKYHVEEKLDETESKSDVKYFKTITSERSAKPKNKIKKPNEVLLTDTSDSKVYHTKKLAESIINNDALVAEKPFVEDVQLTKEEEKHSDAKVTNKDVALIDKFQEENKKAERKSKIINLKSQTPERFSHAPKRKSPTNNIIDLKRVKGSIAESTKSSPTSRHLHDGFIELNALHTKRKKNDVPKDDLEICDKISHAPWMDRPYPYENENLFLRLHEEILDFATFVSPTNEECQMRSDFVHQFKDLVQKNWKKAVVSTFGSQETQMYLPTSDIDVVIIGLSSEKKNLLKLADILKDEDMITYVEVIATARIPIVKFTHKPSGLVVDVSFNIQGGLDSAALIKKYMREYPPFRPLALVLKYFLIQRGLNETYSGGIGSFLLQMMIISFLQHYSRQSSGEYVNRNMLNLGHLLYGFFQLYGRDFNYHTLGICVRGDGSYFKKSELNFFYPDRPYLLAVENPLEKELDVGKNSWDVKRIRRAFENAYLSLHAEIFRRGQMHGSDRRFRGSLLVHLIHLDDMLSSRKGPKELGFFPIAYISQKGKRRDKKREFKR